ncbi:homogentisate 1,2-dioxygenase [Massilia sp. W12]|uniref:homogentisate 1,2-dioxygenase n=1 Tax=Massilia sp. W12 TaxID=3126507 RepID=UPI0030D61909
MSELQYMSGFGNEFATEALPGALPQGQNSPQKCAYGLYAEQISGTAFTAPRAHNRRTWMYRIRPAVVHGRFARIDNGKMLSHFDAIEANPNQMRWSPQPMPAEATDFIAGWTTMAGNGSPESQTGLAVHLYAANADMGQRFFYNADGELLIVPQAGRLHIATELGRLDVAPQEICVIPRGVRFQVSLPDGQARGYICENFGAHLRLPDLGVIGSNGLANPRDFQTPVAAWEDRAGDFTLVAKMGGNLWAASIGHSPLDVVAWHGNMAPYKYDLRHFNTIGSISYDHPDPSIFLVLQSPSNTPGVDVIDFVIFPPRWLAAENTFRPPWFHRNIAAEFMGLIHGEYDAKADGFVPGGASLHNTMSGHGPDAATFEKASNISTATPHKVADTMAFMFESCNMMKATPHATQSAQLQADYAQCWQSIQKHFNPDQA